MEPGRKIDVMTWELPTRSPISLPRSRSFTPRPLPFPLLPLPLATDALLVALEPHAVGVAVAPGTGVHITGRQLSAELAEDDDSRRAPVYAQRAAGADVFVDDERNVVTRIFTRLVGADRVVDRGDAHHVDALPGTDVDTALAEDALRLVDVQELLGLDRLGEVARVDFLQHVIGREVGHRRVRVVAGHASGSRFQRSTEARPAHLDRLASLDLGARRALLPEDEERERATE